MFLARRSFTSDRTACDAKGCSARLAWCDGYETPRDVPSRDDMMVTRPLPLHASRAPHRRLDIERRASRSISRPCRLCLQRNRAAEVNATDGWPADEQATIGTAADNDLGSTESGQSVRQWQQERAPTRPGEVGKSLGSGIGCWGRKKGSDVSISQWLPAVPRLSTGARGTILLARLTHFFALVARPSAA